jgi:uncharacterized DUF497 family protein
MTSRPYSFDEDKAISNLRKHHVSFDDGFAVLMQDEGLLWQFLDNRQKYGEDRWMVIGPLPSHLHTLLHVTWTDRDDDDIHIISVRRVTPAERRNYAKRYHSSR